MYHLGSTSERTMAIHSVCYTWAEIGPERHVLGTEMETFMVNITLSSEKGGQQQDAI